jgi:hypothetical protein
LPQGLTETQNAAPSTTQEKRQRGRPFGSTKENQRKKKQKVLWRPQPKQVEALLRTEYEILYGGARGGGKSAAGRAWLLYPFYDFNAKKLTLEDLKQYRALIIRLNAKDLSDWVDKAREMYEPLGAQFVGSPIEIRWPSGPIFRTGHLKDENAYTQYQGHEYQKMLIEELTQIPDENSYEKLISSCRSTVPGIDAQIFATTNPGNIGHNWVKKRWHIEDKTSWSKPILGMSAVIQDKLIERFRIFIHATVEDNPKLIEADPGYVAQLESIADPNLKKAWRDGDWDDPIIPGQIYKDELDAAREQGRLTQVPYDTRYPVHTYWDIGAGDATAIWFLQYTGASWKAIDFYTDRGKGFSHYKQVLDNKKYIYGQHFGPHDLLKRQMTGTIEAQTIADIARSLGINFYILPKEEVNKGILTVKEKFSLVSFDEEKCKLGLDALRAYRREWDEDKQMFTDKPIHDWASDAADAFRQWAMAPEPANGSSPDYQMYSQQSYS